jgi:hypothetical protein
MKKRKHQPGETVDSDKDGSSDDRFRHDIGGQRLRWVDGRLELVGQLGQIHSRDSGQEMLDDRDLELLHVTGSRGCCRAEAGGDAIGTLAGLSEIINRRYIFMYVSESNFPAM